MELIDAYSRADMLADGGLVDASALAREARFTVPVALTRAAWEDCVAWVDADNDRKGTLQDETGRLWDVLWMARLAARRATGGDRELFEVFRVPRAGRSVRANRVTLALCLGVGDVGEPVITIMQPQED